ncbi:MAG: NUDIX hydrolase [Acidimicrobiales bacterium]|jgi:8-oxo-dGTP diphosphatase|nr:NUDIX hydrolase [Acidimicrobiales bacterium]
MGRWKVAGGLITRGAETLLVANRRRDGRVDWSTPGGVVDEGETPLFALSREVHEETGLKVDDWSRLCWTTEVDFVDLEMHLLAEVHLAESFAGDLLIDDPDGIVVEAHFLDAAKIDTRLTTAPVWVAEPMRDWLTGPWDEIRHFGYRAMGRSPAEMSAERVS